MSSTFLAQNNINMLRNTISQIVGQGINFDQILIQKINEINSNMRNNPPGNMSLNNYVMKQNKRAISLVMNDQRLKQLVAQNRNHNNVPNNNHNNYQQNSTPNNNDNQHQNHTQPIQGATTSHHVFDPSRQIYREANTNVMDRPQLQNDMRRNLQMTERMNHFRENRDQMFPKQEDIDFTDDVPDNEEPADKLYESRLQQRQNEIQQQPQSVPIGEIRSQSLVPQPQAHIEPRQTLAHVEPRQTLAHIEPRQKKKSYYINIDSRYRDLSRFPNPTNFEITINKNQTAKTITELKDQHGNLIHESKRLTQPIISEGVNFIIPDNITEVECKQVIVPPKQIRINDFNGTRFNEPYLMLQIDELAKYSSSYLSNNGFAKLVPRNVGYAFVELETTGDHEICDTIPDNISMNSLTINLLKNNGLNYFRNVKDKIYIKGLYDQSIILQNGAEAKGLDIGDTLYFYDCSPSMDDVIFFNMTTKIKNINECEGVIYDIYDDKVISADHGRSRQDDVFVGTKNLMCITMEVLTNGGDNERNVYSDIDFKYVFPKLSSVGKFKTINGYQFLPNNVKDQFYFFLSFKSSGGQILNKLVKIHGFNRKGVIVEIPENFNKKSILKSGFVECDLRGRQNNNEDSLFYQGGHEIVDIDQKNSTLVLETEFNETECRQNDIFFIQSKLQTNFTFRIA